MRASCSWIFCNIVSAFSILSSYRDDENELFAEVSENTLPKDEGSAINLNKTSWWGNIKLDT